ncbi:hypothetical protein QAD02_002110 [Eretmocerus hayati]|uniref:Uncharacterized protein n=1 Tax=Eretmocerus hayati TaxID=131215 RepID=A0ACC2NID0_9HYME|nr:hypothetical protein QAD02_002110 [Eretmocerus hayati]
MPLQELLRRIEDLETGLQSVNVNIHILNEEAASTGRLISEQFALNSSTQNIIFDQSQNSLKVQENNTKAVERLKALLNSQNQQIETLSKRLRETENLLFSALFKASQTRYVARLETGPGIFPGECLVTNRNGMASLSIINTNEKEISLTIPPVMLQEFDETLKPIRTIGKVEKCNMDLIISDRVKRILKLLDLEGQGRVHNNADALSRNPTDRLKRPLDKTQGEEDQRATKKVKTLQQDEPTNETRVVLCVFPETPGCTPAGKVLPEDSRGPATSGTTPTARSSKRARENLIGAPAQSQEGKTSHSYVNGIGIDIGSPAKKFKLSDWGGRNNGRNDDVHIQETSYAVGNIETVGRRDEEIDGIELVGGVGNIGPVEGILEDIMPVGRIVENIGPIESEIIGPVERIVENIGPIEGEIIGPVKRIVENIGPVEKTGEDTIEEIGNIGPVGGSVRDIAEIGHIVDEIEIEPVKYVERIEGYTIEKPHTSLLTEEESGKHHTSLLTEEKSGKHHTSLLTEEESGKPHTSLLTGEESGKHHTSLLTEEESGKTHTFLLTEEESGTFRDIDNIDYKLGQLEISPPGTAAWDIFPIKINDQFRRRNMGMIHMRRKETSQTKDKSSLRDLGYNWKTVDLLSKSEVDVFNPIKRKWSDSPVGDFVYRDPCISFNSPFEIRILRNAASWRLHFVYGRSCDVALEEPPRIAAKRSGRDGRGSPQSEASGFDKSREYRRTNFCFSIGMRMRVSGPPRHRNADVNKEEWPCYRETGMRKPLECG